MKSMIARLSISTKVSILNFAGMLMLSGAILGVIGQVLSRDLERQAVEMQTLSMEIAWSALSEKGSDFALRDGKLMLGNLVLNDNNEVVDKIKKITGGTATIFQGDTRVATNVMKPDGSRAVGTKLGAGPAYDAVIGRGTGYRGMVKILGEDYYAAYDPIKDKTGQVVGIVYVGIKKAAVFKSFDENMRLATIGVIGFAVLLAVPGFLLLRGLLDPLSALKRVMDALSQGNLQAQIAGTNRLDEIGNMARAVVVFRDGMVEAERLRVEQERQRLEGEEQKRRALEEMAATVERESREAVSRVAERTEAMDSNAGAMAQSAGLVGTNAQDVAAAAEQALSNAQAVASASDELTASIRDISLQVTQASRATAKAVEASRHTGETIQSLSSAVGRIGEVTGLIQSIASQTNLLALNATIEAARAGEAGRGFAVVASEVKNLANQTSTSTEEITRQIAEIQAVTQAAVNAVEDVGSTISEIDQIAAGIAAAMEQQAAATDEIARNVNQTATAATAVSVRIAEVSAEATNTRERADEVRQVAGGVAASIDELKRVLVRVVRTATTEVDRRRFPRYRIDAACTLTVGVGAAMQARVIDLSRCGAALRTDGAATMTGRGSLTLTDLGMAVPFDVVGHEGDLLHVRFRTSDMNEADFNSRFDRLERTLGGRLVA